MLLQLLFAYECLKHCFQRAKRGLQQVTYPKADSFAKWFIKNLIGWQKERAATKVAYSLPVTHQPLNSRLMRFLSPLISPRCHGIIRVRNAVAPVAGTEIHLEQPGF